MKVLIANDGYVPAIAVYKWAPESKHYAAELINAHLVYDHKSRPGYAPKPLRTTKK